ncbi:gustatory receptor for sugar taste 64a-like [Culicoides brevitarsis]|uniref:gustatory receptor for sugar taste 64a-like n=1 Tax=Culicoides brevitarsis TaxID=469753 RepID=UPI00307BC8A7
MSQQREWIANAIVMDNEVSNSKILEHHLNNVWMRALLISKIVPIFPVSGIMSQTPDQLRFHRRSFVYVINTIIIIVGIIDTILTINLVLQKKISVSSITAFAFFLVTVIANLLLRDLAGKWPALMMYWYKKEEVFLGYPYKQPKRNPTWVITLISAGICLMVCIEHVFYYLNGYNATKVNIEKCNFTGKVEFWQHMFHRERAHIYNVIPYSPWIVPLFQLENFAFSLSSSYIDIMLISISIGISTRFNQLNDRLKEDLLSIKTENEWLCMRQHYGNLSDLVRKVNKHISTLILLSCSNNLYFIVVYIFRSSTPRESAISQIHFYIVMSVLFVRTISMLFATSTINDSSKEIVNVLRRVPTNLWNIEVNRFIDQIEAQTVAFSGKSLFILTRKLILAFAGTIVTFEIALLDKVPKETTSKTFKCEFSF